VKPRVHNHVRWPYAALVLVLSALHGYAADTVLSQRAAVERALRDHPQLAAQRAAIQAVDAARVQAGLRPNPELSLQIEELRFSDGPDRDTVTFDAGGEVANRSLERVDNSGLAESEITLAISQRIELGRKRAKRIDLADEASQVALWDYEIARADVIARTRRAFVAVLAGQERVDLRSRLADIARIAAQTVRERVEGGKVSPLEGHRADIAYAQARIALTAAERDLHGAKTRLASQWGAAPTAVGRVAGHLAEVPALPDSDALQSALQNNPELGRWTSEIARLEAAAHVERAQRIPDLTVTAGWRNNGLPDASGSTFDGTGALDGFSRSDFDDDRENSLVVGLSIPLPLFDRNQGRIREAEHRVREAAHRRRALATDVTGQITDLRARLAGIRQEIQTLQEDILPAAADAHAATQTGFDLGKFSYLNVLDAQRTLFEVRNQHVEALAAYHAGVVELERMLGSGLAEFENVDPPTETPDEQ